MSPRPSTAALLAFLVGVAVSLSPAAGEAAGGTPEEALVAALPADGATDILFVEHPSRPNAPRVRAATRVAAAPDAVRAVLHEPALYRKIIPGLVRIDLEPVPGGATSLAWELEIPLFNLEGRLTLRERPNGIELDLQEGDLSPGKIVFAIAPHPSGGSVLTVDAQVDIKHSTWLLRRIMARSPVGEPAALTAATYVALRAVALRAEHAGAPKAWRPYAPMSPPPAWTPESRPLVGDGLAGLRARGVVAFVSRTGTGRLAGVAAAVTIKKPAPAVAGRLRDPGSWKAFPGWTKIRILPGPNGPGAEIGDSLPLADFDSTWTAEPGLASRWTATDGVVRGARLGWDVYAMPGGKPGSNATVAALLLYPRIELTGRIARRSIASEPLLEHGLAIALAFANATAMQTALER